MISDRIPNRGLVLQHKACFIRKFLVYIWIISRSIAAGTRCVLDGPVYKARCKRGCLYPYRSGLGPTQPPIHLVLGFFVGCKAAGEWLYPPLPSSVEAKERVEPYLYSPSGLSWYVIGKNLPLSSFFFNIHYKLFSTHHLTKFPLFRVIFDNLVFFQLVLNLHVDQLAQNRLLSELYQEMLMVYWLWELLTD